MAEFQPFNLGQVLQTAEAIKAARSQSTTDRLREQYMGEQINNMRSDRERQTRQDEIVLGKEKAQQVAVKAGQILQAQNPKNYVEQFEPDLVKNISSQGIDWNTIDDNAVRQMVQAMQAKANQELGVAPVSEQQVGGFKTLQQGGKVIASDSENSGQPNSVREYQYAKENGFQGSFKDWVVAGGQNSRPSSVQEWDFFSKLPDDQKRIYLEMKRNPNMQVKDIGMVPTVVAPSNLGTQTTALSSLSEETAAASAMEGAKKTGQLEGTARTEARLDLPKSEAQAKYMVGLLDKLGSHRGLKDAVGVKGITNYLPGTAAADFNALREQVGGRQFLEAFESLKGGGQITEVEGEKAQNAIARMQTSQSEAAFKEATNEFKTIVNGALQRSRTRAQGGQQQGPARISSDADYDALPSGAVFMAPDGTQRRKP
jgi:hypothetical protein